MKKNSTPDKTDQPLAFWEVGIQLAGNRFYIYDLAKLFFFTFLITAGISLLICIISGKIDAFPFMLKIFFCLAAGITILSYLISLLLFANRYAMRFELSEKKVAWETRSKAGRAAGPLAFIIGLLSGKPTVAGVGALAIAGQAGRISWKKIRKFKEYPAQRVIVLKNSWRVVARLFCTPENYGQVSDIVRGHATAAKRG
jgi:hypothetical protein